MGGGGDESPRPSSLNQCEALALLEVAGTYQTSESSAPESRTESPETPHEEAISSATSPPPLRRGKWTSQEEAYVVRIIHDFNAGLLDAPAGTTLRSYLSDKLNCDPMRITKKFTGGACIGKRVFLPLLGDQPNVDEDNSSGGAAAGTTHVSTLSARQQDVVRHPGVLDSPGAGASLASSCAETTAQQEEAARLAQAELRGLERSFRCELERQTCEAARKQKKVEEQVVLVDGVPVRVGGAGGGGGGSSMSAGESESSGSASDDNGGGLGAGASEGANTRKRKEGRARHKSAKREGLAWVAAAAEALADGLTLAEVDRLLACGEALVDKYKLNLGGAALSSSSSSPSSLSSSSSSSSCRSSSSSLSSSSSSSSCRSSSSSLGASEGTDDEGLGSSGNPTIDGNTHRNHFPLPRLSPGSSSLSSYRGDAESSLGALAATGLTSFARSRLINGSEQAAASSPHWAARREGNDFSGNGSREDEDNDFEDDGAVYEEDDDEEDNYGWCEDDSGGESRKKRKWGCGADEEEGDHHSTYDEGRHSGGEVATEMSTVPTSAHTKGGGTPLTSLGLSKRRSRRRSSSSERKRYGHARSAAGSASAPGCFSGRDPKLSPPPDQQRLRVGVKEPFEGGMGTRGRSWGGNRRCNEAPREGRSCPDVDDCEAGSLLVGFLQSLQNSSSACPPVRSC